MRLNYILITIAILLSIAIGFTLKGERYNPNNWRKEKVNLQWEYVDNTKRIFPSVLEINYLEEENDIYNLFILSRKSEVEKSKEHITQGEYSAEIIFGTTWEDIVLAHFPKEWKRYRHLKLDIYNPQNKSMHLQFRMGDFFDAKSFYLSSQKFKKEVKLEKGWNKLSFNIEEISKQININSSHKSIHLSFFPQPGEKVYVDNIRLVKR